MLAAVLLLAAAVPQTAFEADRALAAAARKEGSWTAFRRFAAPDAIVFDDGPHRAATLLAGQPDPASAMTWTVAESWTSCDGTTAFTAGPARNPSGETGALLLVWRKQADGGWKWVAWRGAAWAATQVAGPRIAVASCAGEPPGYMKVRPTGESGGLWSPDRTLMWDWETGPSGAVVYSIKVWNGTSHVTAVSGGDDVRVRSR